MPVPFGEQEIVSYPLKSPFDILQLDDQGALLLEKWR